MKQPIRTLSYGGTYGPVGVTQGGAQGGRCAHLGWFREGWQLRRTPGFPADGQRTRHRRPLLIPSGRPSLDFPGCVEAAPGDAESGTLRPRARGAPSADRCAHAPRFVGPVATSEHPVVAVACSVEMVPAPLPYSAEHVVETERVGTLQRDPAVPNQWRPEKSMRSLRAGRSAGRSSRHGIRTPIRPPSAGDSRRTRCPIARPQR